MTAVERFLNRLVKRVSPFMDLTAWVLLSISIIPLLFIDVAMVVTLLQWTGFAIALAGITIIVTRLFFPQVDLTKWLAEARQAPGEGRTAAAVVVAAVSFVMGCVFLGLVLWSKA